MKIFVVVRNACNVREHYVNSSLLLFENDYPVKL